MILNLAVRRRLGTKGKPFMEFQIVILEIYRNTFIYSKVASFNTSCLEARAGFFRLLMKGIFDPNVL